jgi:hypothetical protein
MAGDLFSDRIQEIKQAWLLVDVACCRIVKLFLTTDLHRFDHGVTLFDLTLNLSTL